MTFQEAVETAPEPVRNALRSGKRALKGGHRSCVEASDASRFAGSIDLDNSVGSMKEHRNSPRWDYGIGFREANGREAAVWIEVHPASTSDVDQVLTKLNWLKQWLQEEALELWRMSWRSNKRQRAFYWIATSSKVAIPKNSRYARQLYQAGLDLPRRTIVLE